MTIVVFDINQKKAYADSQTSIMHKKKIIDKKKSQKLVKINHFIIGGSGVVSGIEDFYKYIKKHNKAPKKIYNEAHLIVFNEKNNEIYSYDYNKESQLIKNIGLIFFLLMFYHSFQHYFLSFFCLFFFFFLVYDNIFVRKYTIHERMASPNSNIIYTGSGSDVFYSRYNAYSDSLSAIKEVYLYKPCCDNDIKSIDISGKYFYEDVF